MSRLSVVDLAGSERARNTQTHGDRLKEAGKINQSLMILGRCFEVIRSNDVALSRGKQVRVSLKVQDSIAFADNDCLV
jgi:kinesin family protein 20